MPTLDVYKKNEKIDFKILKSEFFIFFYFDFFSFNFQKFYLVSVDLCKSAASQH